MRTGLASDDFAVERHGLRSVISGRSLYLGQVRQAQTLGYLGLDGRAGQPFLRTVCTGQAQQRLQAEPEYFRGV